MQCKDIPEIPILQFLKSLDKPANWFYIQNCENTVQVCFPKEAQNTKLVIAKMNKLIKKGLVSGCGCGCRGDFLITEKGLNYLNDLDKQE